MISKNTVILNKTGLHARPASLFITTANGFKSHITITKDGKEGNAKSILNLLGLCLSKDSEITISAEGEDEVAAVDALVQLVESKFGEE